MKKAVSIALIVAVLLMFATPVFADDIVDIAVGNPDFSILAAAWQEADLVGALQGDGPFTVFAPTNDAFAALLAALGVSAEDLLAQPDLLKVLLYHVVSGAVLSTDLEDGMTAVTLNGESVTVSLDGDVFINDSEVVAADIEAFNGVIHVIDAVLVPSDFELMAVGEEEVVAMPRTGVCSMLPLALTGLAGALGAWAVSRKED